MLNKIKGFFKKPEPVEVTFDPVRQTKTTLQLARDIVAYMNANSLSKYTASEMETLSLQFATEIDFQCNEAMEMVGALLGSHDLKGYELAKELVDKMNTL